MKNIIPINDNDLNKEFEAFPFSEKISVEPLDPTET